MKKKKIYLIIFFLLIVTACKSPQWLYQEYKLSGKNSFLHLNQYSKNEFKTLNIKQMYLSHQNSEVSNFPTFGSIFFEMDCVANSLNNAYSNAIGVAAQTFKTHEFDSELPIHLNILSKIGSYNHDSGVQLIPIFRVTNKSMKRIYGGGGLEIPEDSGLDLHWVKYELHTSIFRNDSLIYWDNRFYWDSIMSERDEIVHYDIPISILDSLVELTTLEYKKRLVD